MKKIILEITAILLTITLSACGASSNDAAITNLGNQLDETANTITSFKTINPNDLSISTEKTNTLVNETNTIISNSQQAQFSLLNEQYYKTDILRQIARLKSSLSKNLKLSKSQISAVKDYTNNLGKYTNSIAYTESEMENATKSVSSLKKNISKNTEKINAKLSRLTCNSNARSAYFENILHTLEELESCLNLNINQNENQIPPTMIESHSNDSNKNDTPNFSQPQTENNNSKLNNIDAYITHSNNSTTENTDDCKLCDKDNNRLFVPVRNTDSYAPTVRNIDTYGINNGIGYGINTPFWTNKMYGGNRINNGMFRNRFYGNGYGYNYGFNQMNSPYGEYNSNNINRMTVPYQYQAVVPVDKNSNTNMNPINTPTSTDTTVQNESGQRIEDYEILNDENTIEKSAESNQIQTNKNADKENDTINEVPTIVLSKIELHKTPQTRIVDATKIQESKSQTDNKDDLNKIVVAH